MQKAGILLSIVFFLSGNLLSQISKSEEAEFQAQYERNIKKERINGVYIPKNMSEAFEELIGLSEGGGIEKFKNAPEEVIARKLHFGLGRWISTNWNFYEGSRFSHYLKEMGVSHPDDKVQFVIVSFHRYLNHKDLELELRATTYKDARKKTQEEKIKEGEKLYEKTLVKDQH